MNLIKNVIEEIPPMLQLTKADLLILHAARGICEQARQLTTESIDDDSIWADAQLALNAAIESYQEQTNCAAIRER